MGKKKENNRKPNQLLNYYQSLNDNRCCLDTSTIFLASLIHRHCPDTDFAPMTVMMSLNLEANAISSSFNGQLSYSGGLL